MNIYQEHGYEDRTDYLASLVEDYNLDWDQVWVIAQVYGPSEDFDGLITALEDLADQNWDN